MEGMFFKTIKKVGGWGGGVHVLDLTGSANYTFEYINFSIP